MADGVENMERRDALIAARTATMRQAVRDAEELTAFVRTPGTRVASFKLICQMAATIYAARSK